MAETEVEIILREIRERVLAEQRAARLPETAPGAGNGNRVNQTRALELAPMDDALIAEKLALLNSHLVTLARAWDRLPAIVSKRSGLSARIELWIKRQLKRTTRWYSWEQVNFNASVHQSIRDVREILQALETNHRSLQSKYENDLERHQEELRSLRVELDATRAAIEPLRALVEEQSRIIEKQRLETKAQIAQALSEVRDRIEHLQDEHRVAFKQLSLEKSEAAVLEDRARRNTETLVEELKQRVDKLNK